jgi:hypothetical protein
MLAGMAPEQDKQPVVWAVWGAFAVAAYLAWRVWAWRWQGIEAQANDVGAGLLVLIGFAAVWTLGAFTLGFWVAYNVLRGLGAVVRVFTSGLAEGWRRVYPKD